MSDANLEQYLCDHPLREDDELWNEIVHVVAKLIDKGMLFYDARTGKLIRMSTKQ